MPRIDLSSYPDRIVRISSEYKQNTGRHIEFKPQDNIPNAGNALGKLMIIDNQAVIDYRNDLSKERLFQIICHELLHLELFLRGYPPLYICLENDPNAKDLVIHLESILHHLIIMPIESNEFGYNPYIVENEVSNIIYGQISSTKEFGPIDDNLWKFLYSLFGVGYCRVMMLADDSEIKNKFEELFSRPEYGYPFNIALNLLRYLNECDLYDSNRYTIALQKILNEYIHGNIINGDKRIDIETPYF